MKKIIPVIVVSSLCLAACEMDTIEQTDETIEQTADNHALTDMINRLTTNSYQNGQSKNSGLQQTQSVPNLQNLIDEVEAEAFEDNEFLQLVTTSYTTPQATDIEAILTDANAVLVGLNLSSVVEDYITQVLDTDSETDLNSLEQTVVNDVQLTITEKKLLQDIIELKKDGNGDDDWEKRKIIGYAQGYRQSNANAVLNAVIIKVLKQNN